jgi:hypothetical protein
VGALPVIHKIHIIDSNNTYDMRQEKDAVKKNPLKTSYYEESELI